MATETNSLLHVTKFMIIFLATSSSAVLISLSSMYDNMGNNYPSDYFIYGKNGEIYKYYDNSYLKLNTKSTDDIKVMKHYNNETIISNVHKGKFLKLGLKYIDIMSSNYSGIIDTFTVCDNKKIYGISDAYILSSDDMGEKYVKLLRLNNNITSITSNDKCDIIMISEENIGVKKSVDNGRTFTISQNDGNIKFVKYINGNWFSSSMNNGLYTSTDNGNTWVHINESSDFSIVDCIFYIPENSVLCIGTSKVRGSNVLLKINGLDIRITSTVDNFSFISNTTNKNILIFGKEGTGHKFSTYVNDTLTLHNLLMDYYFGAVSGLIKN